MTERLKTILRGVGSVLDICPPADPAQASIPKTPADRMRRPWERTGQALKRAMGSVEREQTTS